jgi:hypothetical protein
VSCRAAVKALPPSFWSSESRSKPQQLVDRILTTPATAGGFAIAVACEVVSPSKGIKVSPGTYNTIDHEMGQVAKLFRTAGNAERLRDCTFKVTDRSQPVPGQMMMLYKSNTCSARLAALHTPKWCLLAVYHVSDVDAEAITLQSLDELRKEAFLLKFSSGYSSLIGRFILRFSNERDARNPYQRRSNGDGLYRHRRGRRMRAATFDVTAITGADGVCSSKGTFKLERICRSSSYSFWHVVATALPVQFERVLDALECILGRRLVKSRFKILDVFHLIFQNHMLLCS